MSSASAPQESRLDDVRRHSKIDLDGNDADVAVDFRVIRQQNMPLFGDMTSNSIIVLNELLSQEGERRRELISDSVRTAKSLLDGTLDAGEFRERLALERGGIYGAESDEQRLEQLVVDVATVSLGLLVLPSLQQTGSAHAQVNTTLREATHIVKHAQRYSAMYQLLSKQRVKPASICIKIPATLGGLKACAELQKKGVRTLATTVFTVEQGLAAAEAAGCAYIAPYINALSAHFYDAEQVPASARTLADTTEAIKMVHQLQVELRRRSSKTELMAASFVAVDEVASLTGIDRMTISPALLAKLRDTPMDATAQQLRDHSLSQLKLSTQGAVPQSAGSAWLTESGEAAERLKAALEAPRTKALLDDALARFGTAEVKLRQLAKERIASA